MAQDISMTTHATTLLQNANGKLGLDRLAAAAKIKSDEKINAAAQDFESVFISEMLKPMFETVGVDDMFGGGKGEEVFRGMMVQEMGKSIAKQGGLGIADQVRAELIKIQSAKS